MKLAILQVADTGPLESIVVMLRSVGYECAIPSKKLKQELRSLGCDTVLDIEDLVKGMGYDPPFPLPEAGVVFMTRPDVVYVDVKAHRNAARVWRKWPDLKVMWYRINGGKPEHVKKVCDACDGEGSQMYQWAKEACVKSGGRKVAHEGSWYYVTGEGKEIEFKTIGGACSACKGAKGVDHGDEINPPCPVLTSNQWYAYVSKRAFMVGMLKEGETNISELGRKDVPFINFDCMRTSWNAYTCWPPFHRFDEYAIPRNGTPPLYYLPPVCFIHNLQGWGYQDLVPHMRALGVRCHGDGSPDGLLPHSIIPQRLAAALAYVHLKSSDAPGYALYEALAAACPVICTRRLIWRCRMQDLFIPNETCLVFDRETHDGLNEQDIIECTREVAEHLERLRDPTENKRIGENGRRRLREVMWRDAGSLREFMTRHFG